MSKRANKMKKIKVLHMITALEVGGASKNTIQSVEYLNATDCFSSDILCGPVQPDEKNLIGWAKEKKIEITFVNSLNNSYSPFKGVKAIYDIYRYLKKEKYHIVHTHSSFAGIFGRIAAKLAGVPIIIHTVHGWGIRPDMSRLKLWAYVGLERFCARFTDCLIVVSRFNIDKGMAYNIGRKSQYEVIHSAIDVKRFQKKINVKKKKKELGLQDGMQVIAMIGRLDKQKNPLDFVKLASKVQKDFEKVQFLVVGDGPLREQTEGLASKLGVKNFHIIGFRHDVEEIMQVLDINVLTSLWEGLPRVFPESMAAGKPIVCYAVDGAPEAVIDGENGYIVDIGELDLMSSHIVCLLKDPALRKKMGSRGKSMVQKFSLERMLADIDGLYSQQLAKKGLM